MLVASGSAILGVVLLAYFYLPPSGKQSASVLDPANNWVVPHLRAVPLGLIRTTGFQLAATGSALVAIFYFLLRLNRTTVPVTVAATSTISPARDAVSPDDDHGRTMRFVWIMIALPLVAWILTNGTNLIITFVVSASPSPHRPAAWLDYSEIVVSLLFFSGLVAFALGKEGFRGLRESLRVPPTKYSLLAVIYPATLASVWPLLCYSHDRILWAAFRWNKFLPPVLPNYFHTITAASFVYLPSIFVEEVAWRAYLQPRFIRRYGPMRGIFLVGVVWGAFHFAGFFYAGSTLRVTWELVDRLIGTCILSYPLAWLTIRSKSIHPAVITHELYDVTLSLPARGYDTPLWFNFLVWAALGFVLFQFYAPESEQQTDEPAQPAIA